MRPIVGACLTMFGVIVILHNSDHKNQNMGLVFVIIGVHMI